MEIADMAASIQECRGLILDHSLAGDKVFGSLLVNPMMKALFALPRELRLSRPYRSFLHSRLGKATSARLLRLLVSEDEMTRLLALASLAKFASTDMAMGIASRALQLMGPEDSEERRRVEKCYRDVKVTQIYEGTNQLNRLTWFMVEQEGSLRIELPRPPR
jgi:alkylation response protein AidB-like acyl-CoA dehydrogenase